MAHSEWTFSTATELTAALDARKVSAVELAQAAIGQIEHHDGDVNAICVRDFDRALEAARSADAARGRGERGALLGLPLTIKESFNLAGTPTTWGFVDHKAFMPAEDALAVQRVKAAGGVILGKTNVPVGLADWQSYNPIYGRTNNPFDLGRSPGGSSGGSSAALAAGYGPLSLGSDIGGSLRVPAAFCGVYAHKPTYALVPSRGHVPPPFPALPLQRDLAVIGPMARSAADLALLLDVMADPDPWEAGVGFRLALPPPRHAALADYRVLLLDTHPLLPTAASIRGALATLETSLGKAGVTIRRQSDLLPDLAAATRLYMRLLLAALSASFPPEVIAGAQAAAAALPATETSLAAERLRGIAMSHRDWVIADAGRARLRAQWRALFEAFDAVICPVMPTEAYPHDQATEDQETRRIVIDGQPHVYPDQLAWPGIATLPGLPATALPIGQSAEGLPIGVQIIGPWLEDRTPIRLAGLIEREVGGFVAPRGFG